MNDGEVSEAIRRACAEIGTAPPDSVMVDGIIHRYYDSNNDRPRQCNGWYIAHHNPDGTTGGAVGSWKIQASINWCTSVARIFTAAERAEFARQQAIARMKAETARQQRKTDAATRAAYLWRRSRPADPSHPYIIRKGIQPHRARQSGAALVLDYRNNNGIITTLQFIQPDGTKKFLADGATGGSSHRFGGKMIDSIILAEGFATGATLHEATGCPVAVCGSAGNLCAVAVGIHGQHPGVKIIVAGDADPVGRGKALEAAEAVGGVVCLPDFEGGVHDN